MRFGVLAKDKPERIFVAIKANEALEVGDLCVFAMNGTDDGLAVAKGSTGNFVAGVAGGPLPIGGFGVAQVFGVCEVTNLVRATRALTSASWATAASVSAGESIAPNVFAVASVASFAGAASASTDTRTAYVTPIKTFLRIL